MALLCCSTRCQIVVAYEIGSGWPISQNSPLPSIRVLLLISEYAILRIEEIRQIEIIEKRWENNGDSLFYSIALSTSLFRFASRGLEKTLSRLFSERFNTLCAVISSLYPKITYKTEDFDSLICVDPLGLPRLPDRSYDITFDPYQPFTWGEALDIEGLSQNSLWIQERNYVRFKDKKGKYRQTYLPKNDEYEETLFLAPFHIYCPFVIQKKGGSINIDGCFEMGNPGLFEISLLPIARSIVKSNSKNQTKATVDWLFFCDSVISIRDGGKYDFVYRRTYPINP